MNVYTSILLNMTEGLDTAVETGEIRPSSMFSNRKVSTLIGEGWSIIKRVAPSMLERRTCLSLQQCVVARIYS